MNYYQILGIPENASIDEIKQRYKTLIKTYHPDLYKGDKEYATEITKKITQAYNILKDPTSRTDYDNLLRAERAYETNNSEIYYEYTNDPNAETEYTEDVNEFYSEYKDGDFFKGTSKTYKKTITDYVDDAYDNATQRVLNYIFNSNPQIKILSIIVLVLIVVIFFLNQALTLQEMQTRKLQESIIQNSENINLQNQPLTQNILDSITINELQNAYGKDVLTLVENGPFNNIDELKTFYYYDIKNNNN